MAQGQETDVFGWNLHANFNPLQNIVRLFFRFSSAAENAISMHSSVVIPTYNSFSPPTTDPHFPAAPWQAGTFSSLLTKQKIRVRKNE